MTRYEANKRWRKAHPEARQAMSAKNYAQTAFAPRGNQRWTEREDEMVLAHEISDRELSKKIERSMMAIQIRRARLKKDEEEAA